MKIADLRKKDNKTLLNMMQELQLNNMIDKGNLRGMGYTHKGSFKIKENRISIARIKTLLRERDYEGLDD